jgi:hypothetical protein
MPAPPGMPAASIRRWPGSVSAHARAPPRARLHSSWPSACAIDPSWPKFAQVRSAGDRFGAGRTSSSGNLERHQHVVRHRGMKKPSLIVLAGLVVVFGVANCSSSTFRSPLMPVSTVTGFARIPLTRGVPSGPVMVRLTGKEAIRLALLLPQLSPVPGAAPVPGSPPEQVHCQEPLGLMYRIVFAGGDGPVPAEVVEGYRCGAVVAVTAPGDRISSWRRDANCTLIRAVRHVLPGRAKATQSLSIGCGS